MALSSSTSLGGITRVRNHLAEKGCGAATYSALSAEYQNQVNDAIEMALDEIAAACAWQWLKRQYRFTTKTRYTAGTITVTNRSATVTGSSTVWSTGTLVNVAASHLVLGSQSGGYLISAIGGDTSLTIDPIYGGSNASGQTYQILNDQYEMATGCWWIRSLREINSPAPLRLLDMETWVHETGGTYREGTPTHAIIMGADTSAASTTMEQSIQLWPGPDDSYAYELDYRTLPTFPANNFESHPQAQTLAIYKAMQHLWAFQQNEERATYYSEQYQLLLPAFKKMDAARHGDTTLRLRRQWAQDEGEDERLFVTGTDSYS